VKGALVVLMVVYHWINYFVGLDWPGYPYLRFLTPSFLFIAGLLVGRVYLVKYNGSPWQLAQRSWARGLKLLALFALLNFVDTAVAMRSADPSNLAGAWPLFRLAAVFIRGTGGAAFSILVPIAYFLLVVPLIWWLVNVIRLPLQLLAGAMLAFAMAASETPYANTQIEFISIGLAGTSLGAARRLNIECLGTYLKTLALIYVLHFAAIVWWNAPFRLQVVATYANVLLLYALAERIAPTHLVAVAIAELGRYSLFAYIVQIAVLQAVRRGLPVSAGVGTQVLAGVAALVATWGSVRAMAVLRHRYKKADQCYRMVFA
jgi:hypothetical protein